MQEIYDEWSNPFSSLRQHGCDQLHHGADYRADNRYHTGIERDEAEETSSSERVLRGPREVLLCSLGDNVLWVCFVHISRDRNGHRLLRAAATHLRYAHDIEV